MQLLHCDKPYALVPRDLREGEGVRHRRHLCALQLRARLHEAVEHVRLFHTHHVGHQVDAAVSMPCASQFLVSRD